MPTGPFEGPERLAHISTLRLSRPARNSAIETGVGTRTDMTAGHSYSGTPNGPHSRCVLVCVVRSGPSQGQVRTRHFTPAVRAFTRPSSRSQYIAEWGGGGSGRAFLCGLR